MHLQAEAVGLGMVLVAGFDDQAVAAGLGLSPGVEPTALLALGAPSAG